MTDTTPTITLEEKPRLSNQMDIFVPQWQKVFIVGAGSVGSMVCYTLAQMWFTDIGVCDYDVVEDHNIAQQFFKLADCWQPKVVALKDNVETFTGATVHAFDCKFTPEITEWYDIIVIAVDDMEVRKQIVETTSPTIWFVETRMWWEHFLIYTFYNDGIGQERWLTTRYPSSEADQITCTAKGISYNTHVLAWLVCKQISSLIDDKLLRFQLEFDLQNVMLNCTE